MKRLRFNEKFQITNDKSEINSNFQSLSFGLPTLRAGPQFQMTKTLWPECRLNRFEHLDIEILDLFGAWYLGFEIYSLRMRLRPLKNFPQ